MLLDVEHRMHFAYDDFIDHSWLELRVEPRSLETQMLHSFYLAVGPPASVSRYIDWNGNLVHHFGIPDYHDRIEVVARSVVEVEPVPLRLEDFDQPPAPGTGALLDLTLFGGPVERSQELVDLERALPAPADAPLGAQVAALGKLVLDRFRYVSGVTDSRSTTGHILQHGSGVCQDFAHLALGLLRLRGIPCRYVSGYLHVEPRESGEPSQSHAWVEIHAGGDRWIPFDPTHGRIPGERYVLIGRGRNYQDVAPNRGIYRGRARETLKTAVRTAQVQRRDVAALHEQVEQIDVPVYRELPIRAKRASVVAEQDEAGTKQQQQQQQQQRCAQLPRPRRGLRLRSRTW
jgi:transglutaminase-like putative cysteine protease